MLFEDIPTFIVNKLPKELWIIIRKYYIIKCLTDDLKFPIVFNRRLNDTFFADYWQIYCGDHRWDIETGNDKNSTLMSHFFKQKRSSINWSGLMMLTGDRVFGIGFNIDNLFMRSIFSEDDILPLFPRVAWNNYDSDDSFILE